ncbi:bacteriocin-protection, YdeI or OmpD-Associated [Kordia sp. SMS9]|uniref:YdeI/OmpD-associated family protein n=1 Tax=Kordia sp. SMS9 TaxID=2282170 RepID=UPI000E0DE1DD|nr:YdeI/OmpD-associated family protein [Kordia sp. SMS9]AXG70388.1 bacteriocin-protection, YdeI or OmpD-Associated [Kordia sp. SMS9]
MIHEGTQPLQKRGSYYHLEVAAEVVHQWEKKRATRLICTIDDHVTLHCGLNHLGNGDFYIMLAKRYIQKIGKEAGEMIAYKLEIDPNPLGVEIPEVLEVFLAQDPDAQTIFDKLTDGRKRTLIFSILRIKNIDKQVESILKFLQAEHEKQRAKKSNW